jgi:7,8-dihydro-6-hydroxymethylpterin-pyrophosphokinase
MWERAFVLVPLADLAPDLVPDPPGGTDVRPAGTL